MSFLIDNVHVQENVFWQNLAGIASERQMYMIMEGKKLLIGGRTYIMNPAGTESEF